MTTIFKLIVLSSICCLFITTTYAQVGTITTASTTCHLTIASCEGDTLNLVPQNQASYANYKWYFGSVAPANEITAGNAASFNVVAANFAVAFPVINVISGGGTYILTGEYATPSGCSAINDTFQLDFSPRPNANDATLALCETTDGGGTADFTLTDADVTVIGGASGVAVTYHTSLANARNDTAPLSSPYTSSATTLYVRVENTTTGCYQTAILTLEVNAKPDFTLTKPIVCPGSSEEVNVTINANASIPTSLLSIDGSPFSVFASPLTGLSVASHAVTLKNGEGCQTTKSITINQPPAKVCLPVIVTRMN